ncbi:MAG TPA: GWxTD domain-containing protein [Thermoanaerobaculia bacterium]|nr:GWxTD domain-containing protein [Thermoanaerobaculia bacterium]
MKTVLALGVLFSISVSASAALSPKYTEWREGPVQWIMSAEEMKAWKALKTDDEASRFIDLFWVRRDPTKETRRNEYRDEFMARVKASDATLVEPRKKGSMTDRGRVYIVLGDPTTGGMELASNTRHQLGGSAAGNSGDGNRMRGSRSVWMWTSADAQKFDMPQIEVVFIEEAGTGKVQRDPHRPDFMRAGPNAIRKAIVNPELKEVPEWALQGGLEPKTVIITTEVPVSTAAPAVEGTADPAAVAAGGPSPASKLTLLKDIWSINPELKANPFTKVAALTAFKPEDDLGWIAQYCSGSDDEPTVRYGLRLTGTAGNEVIDRVAPPDELVPDRIKAAPGCYLMRGMIPLEGMTPGAYALELSVEDPVTKASHALKQDFTIE